MWIKNKINSLISKTSLFSSPEEKKGVLLNLKNINKNQEIDLLLILKKEPLLQTGWKIKKQNILNKKYQLLKKLDLILDQFL